MNLVMSPGEHRLASIRRDCTLCAEAEKFDSVESWRGSQSVTLRRWISSSFVKEANVSEARARMFGSSSVD